MKTVAAGSGQRAAGSGQRAAGSGQRTEKYVLFAARSAAALHRLLDVLPAFAGDHRIHRRFTLVPGSDFSGDALAAIEQARARTVPWDEACARPYDLILTASPKGELHELHGPRALLPHGAGFGKALPDDGSSDSASGLDPAYLLRDGHPVADLHALAHPSQLTRLAHACPPAAARATVTGDPTLDRILDSLPLRDRYRTALRTHGRRLLVLTSTWGPESLLERRPDLPAELAARLPHDSWQLGLVLHPNEHSRTGEFDLREQLEPALAAGMILARPYEEWAALLVAADAVLTDHGSTALYAAAIDRPLIAACDGGGELIPGTPMAEILTRVPRLRHADELVPAAHAAAQLTSRVRDLAEPAFAERGHAIRRLREELYRLLDLTPRAVPAEPRLLPDPAPATRTPAVFAVRVNGEPDTGLRVERRPAHAPGPAHHLAAEHGEAAERHLQSAALHYVRADRAPTRGESWTVDRWTTHVLTQYPGRRTAAVILSPTRGVLRTTGGPLLSLRLTPYADQAHASRAEAFRVDPAAALSAAHAWLDVREAPSPIRCTIGDHTCTLQLSPATEAEARHAFAR
ncbi:translation initiation factor 2 [Streptomyces apocyni]|uniref:translation initiation factor 2 n=1 Tax=Streptomyces apocyni TaxID=2654677 RepID=UPI001E505E1F|nr:translation initiation factor 2 [Streptomyces apocyni]